MIESIELYTKDNCPYCNRAKHLLTTMNIPFTEKKLGVDFTREILLEKFPLAKTYPVVVEDGWHIGGYTQLVEKINSSTKDTKQLLTE
jgi:glutaredoxin 3